MKKAGKGWAAKQGKLRISSDMSTEDLFAALRWSEQELQENEAQLKRFGYPVPPRAAPPAPTSAPDVPRDGNSAYDGKVES